ncbi:MAG TPA: BamA/TamA family outer membrane protein [Nitrospiraceae bacterium]|nr:BamA/TamA family outer membrane protein [Nitrospiraceae bacterium]
MTHTLVVGTSLCILVCVLTVAMPLQEMARAQAVHESGQTAEQTVSPADNPPPQVPGPLESFLKKGDYTFIPVPAYAYNRNEGYWLGSQMWIFKEDARGHLGTLIVPQYFYNRLVGQTINGNYFRYPSSTTQYEITGSFSEHVARDIDLRYKDVGAGGGRYIIMGQAQWFKNPLDRFFGLGNRAQELQETNYMSEEVKVTLTGGIKLTPDFAVLFTERFRNVKVGTGIVDSLPSTEQRFGQVAGVEGAKVIGHRVTLRYDTRDHQLSPTKGTFITASGEFNQNLQHAEDNRWWRYTIDARTLIPHAQGRMIFVARFLADGVAGVKLETRPTDQGEEVQRGIPFYERPMLGGETTLRAFGQNRFISNSALLFNFEERILVTEREIFGYDIAMEIAPFLDLGRVERVNLWQKLDLKDWQVNPGTGFRLMAKPYVVGRADFAYGRDGFNAFIGLDYPF